MGTAAGTPGGDLSPRRPDGPWHEALAYRSAEHMADRLAPHVTAAVGAGDPVVAVLAPDARDALRAAVGGDADRVEFQDPATVHRVPGFTVAVRWARQSRRISNPDGRALVIGQQLDLPGCGAEHWARLDIGLEVAIAGLPVTVLCPFPADSPELPRLGATHPLLSTAAGPQPSPGYRPPRDVLIDYPPPPPPQLGPPVAELAFGRTDLPALRRLVADIATAGGLSDEHAADVVLAVNELASNSIEHGPGSGRLRLWTGDGVIAEVTDHGRMDLPFPGMELPPPEGARGRGLWLASELSDVLQVWADNQGTVIRLQANG